MKITITILALATSVFLATGATIASPTEVGIPSKEVATEEGFVTEPETLEAPPYETENISVDMKWADLRKHLRESGGIVSQNAREAWKLKVSANYPFYSINGPFEGTNDMYFNQGTWNTIAPTWFSLAGLESLDTQLMQIQIALARWYNEGLQSQAAGNYVISRELFDRIRKYDEFLQLNGDSPFLTDNRRVAINMARLSLAELQVEFPLVAASSPEYLAALWKTAVYGEVVTFDHPVKMGDGSGGHLALGMAADYLSLNRLLPFTASRIIIAGLWHLYQQPAPYRYTAILAFFQSATKYLVRTLPLLKTGDAIAALRNTVYIVLTLATIHRDSMMVNGIRRLLGTVMFATRQGRVRFMTRESFLATLKKRRMKRAVAQLPIVWPESTVDTNSGEEGAQPDQPLSWATDFVFHVIFRLTNDGDLIQAVPSHWISTPGLIERAEHTFSTGGEFTPYQLQDALAARKQRMASNPTETGTGKPTGMDPGLDKLKTKLRVGNVKRSGIVGH
ncbi:hypothetical protein H4R33_003129 [Dimargaris cristalligena]|nr:hypothetical protein H4R33_003129 [Dimargaris cristalligena]